MLGRIGNQFGYNECKANRSVRIDQERFRGENRAGPSPDIRHIRQHDAGAVRRQPDGSRNAEANEPFAVAHRSWLLLTPFPLEPARSFAQAFDDAPLRVRHVSLGIEWAPLAARYAGCSRTPYS